MSNNERYDGEWSDKVVREASLPTQTRVDVRVLAMLAMHWKDRVGTRSRLISKSLEYLASLLVHNNLVREVPTIAEAYNYLRSLGLVKVTDASAERALKAIAFENIRIEGDEPERVAPGMYSQLHNTPNEIEHNNDRGKLEDIVKSAMAGMERRNDTEGE